MNRAGASVLRLSVTTGLVALWAFAGATASLRAAERPGTPSVVIVQLGPVPDGVDATLLAQALDTYLQDVPHERVDLDARPEAVERTAAAVSLAAQRGAEFVAWWWIETTARRITFIASVADVAHAHVAPLAFTVAAPAPVGPELYRQIGIKLRSNLRASMRLGADVGELARTRPSDNEQTTAPAPWPSTGLELAAVATLAGRGDLRGLVPAFGASVAWRRERWSAGTAVEQSLPSTRRVTAGQGRTTFMRGVLAARREVVGAPDDDGLSLAATAQLGAAYVRTRTVLTGVADSERLVSRFLPFASAGVAAAVALGPHWRVSVGARADLFPTNTRFLVHGRPVYASGWLQPGLDLSVAWF